MGGCGMEQAIQIRPGSGDFPPSAFGAGADTESTPGAVSSLLLVGSRMRADELAAMDRVRVSCVEAAEAADHLRARPITDILWLASKEAIEPETFAALCGVAVAKSCRLVCEAPFGALDRLMAVAPGALRVEWLVDADATDRFVALAAARREWYRAMHEVTRDPAMERIDQLQEEVARMAREGVTAAELERAKKDILEGRKQGRADTAALAGGLSSLAERGETWAAAQQRDEALAAVTVEQANAAWRKHIQADRFIISTAGDFKTP